MVEPGLEACVFEFRPNRGYVCRFWSSIGSVDSATAVRGKFLVRVEVTEEFPFLVTKPLPYYYR